MKNRNNPESTHTPKELVSEMQALVAEAQTMMGDSVSEHSSEAVEAIRQRFAAAQEQFAETYEQAKTRIVAGAKATDAKIRENPYQSIAIAVGVGVLLGMLIGRRGD